MDTPKLTKTDMKNAAGAVAPADSAAALAALDRGIYVRGILIGQTVRYHDAGRDPESGRTWPASLSITSEVAVESGTIEAREKFDILDPAFVVKEKEVMRWPQRPLFTPAHIKAVRISIDKYNKKLVFNEPSWLAV